MQASQPFVVDLETIWKAANAMENYKIGLAHGVAKVHRLSAYVRVVPATTREIRV